MSTAWMQMVEPAAHVTSAPKYEDVMAEFRANGQDLESTSSRSSQSSAGPVLQNNPGSAPGVQIQNNQTVQPQPCSLCGTVPQTTGNGDFAKEISGNGTSLSMDMSEFQQHFGAGLKKFLDKPTVNQQDATWPFARKDITPLNPNAALNNIEQLWQLNAINQYARPSTMNSMQANGLNLLKLNQLRNKTIVECVFCRNNGEPVSYYRTHELKDEFGRVTCPVLRTFRCPCCGATGDNAHTIKYCPEKPPEFLPTYSQLKSLRIVPKRRVSLARRITGSQELGNWLNTDQ